MAFPTSSARRLTSSTTSASAILSFYILRFLLMWYIIEKGPLKLKISNLLLSSIYLFSFHLPLFAISLYPFSFKGLLLHSVTSLRKAIVSHTLRHNNVSQHFPSGGPIKYTPTCHVIPNRVYTKVTHMRMRHILPVSLLFTFF